MGGVAVKRSGGAVAKDAGMRPIPIVKGEGLSYLVIAKSAPLGAFKVVSKLPSSVFHLFGETGVARVATAGIGASVSHRLAQCIVIARRLSN